MWIIALFLNISLINISRGTEPSDTRTCGQSCSQWRGNEVIRLQSQYLMNQFQSLQKLFDEEKYSELRNAIGNYCTSSEEHISSCFERYQTIQILMLIKMSSAMKKNYNTITQLDSHILTFQDPEPPKKPTTQYLPTYEELKKLYHQNQAKKGPLISRLEYEAWLQSLSTTLKPNQDDFPVTKDVPLQSPSSQKMSSKAIVKGQYEQKRYRAAEKFYSTQAQHSLENFQKAKTTPAPATSSHAAYQTARDVFLGLLGTTGKDFKTSTPQEKSPLGSPSPQSSQPPPAKDTERYLHVEPKILDEFTDSKIPSSEAPE